MLAVNKASQQTFKNYYFPMHRHLPQPLHPGGFARHAGVEAAGDGLLDDGLLLLGQQLDQLLLGPDVAPDAAVHVVEITHDGALFGEGWDGQR